MKILFYFIFIVLAANLAIAAPIVGSGYTISTDVLREQIKLGNFVQTSVYITNNNNIPITVRFAIIGDISGITQIESDSTTIEAQVGREIGIVILGDSLGDYGGELIISGDIRETIQINASVLEIVGSPIEALQLDLIIEDPDVDVGKELEYRVNLQNLLVNQPFNVTLTFSIDGLGEDATYQFDNQFFKNREELALNTSATLLQSFEVPDILRAGQYVLTVKAEYFDLESSATETFKIHEPVLDKEIIQGLPLKLFLPLALIPIILIIAFIIWKRRQAAKKRYAGKIDLGEMGEKNDRTVFLGKFAETDHKMFYDIDNLTTHAIIAGSTGGGKTVSAKVLVEEALMKGVGIIAFDPTAQWSGILRKNTDKKMFALYDKFGMNKNQARSFPGNIRQITNAREIIDIKKYMVPGEINIFTIHRLDPSEADILVSNTIREVFHANLPEERELKLLILFDEVHRLLPKFGGSGEGFIQIERAAREFRKWGVGLILISQVLTDFVGEIKANINTEIQMRTRDQGDLDRIKNKYGSEMLRSLVKSATGTGMMENPNYNKGEPFFIAYRPLLHEHARLSDDELDNYNKYNDMVDELDYQLEQLKEFKIDTFDLQLELKLSRDKIKSGSFNMVDIYLEGLKPRIEDQWKKLGREPKKKQVRLVSEEALKKEFEKAKAARDKFAKDKKAKKTGTPVKAPAKKEGK